MGKKSSRYPGRLLITGILAISISISGCGLQKVPLETGKDNQIEIPAEPVQETAADENQEDQNAASQSGDAPVAQETIEVEETEVEEEPQTSTQKPSNADEAELEKQREAIGLDDAGIASLRQEMSGYYYYDLCGEKDQITYVELYQILTRRGENILLGTTDLDRLSNVYQCVINDHPEMFYLCGYTYTKHTLKGSVKYLTFSGRYMYDSDEISVRQNEVESVVREILNDVPQGLDQYGVVKYLYEYIIYQTEYGTQSADNQNICSVFLDHVSVCNGYAKALQLLLDRMGIPCLIVNGTAGGGAHAWNIVRIDGVYYQVDVTWGDPSYYNEEQEGSVTPDIDYSYLNVTTEQIRRNHQIDSAFAVPDCSSLAANYFVRENLYFDSVDEDRLTSVFKAAEDSGQKIITIKASDGAVYSQLYDHLLTQQKIFKYYKAFDSQGNYSIAYSTNDTVYTLSFWN